MDSVYQIRSMFPDYLDLYMETQLQPWIGTPLTRMPSALDPVAFRSLMFDARLGVYHDVFTNDYDLWRARLSFPEWMCRLVERTDRLDCQIAAASVYLLLQRTEWIDLLFFHSESVGLDIEYEGWACSACNVRRHYQNHLNRYIPLEWRALLLWVNDAEHYSEIKPYMPRMPRHHLRMLCAMFDMLDKGKIDQLLDLWGIPPFHCSYFGPGF